MDGRAELIATLREARGLLSRDGNDFSWSSWRDAEHAIGEVDGLIAELEAGKSPPRLDVAILFAPTGDVQEVSLSSGWADAFLRIAERYDAAEAQFYGV